MLVISTLRGATLSVLVDLQMSQLVSDLVFLECSGLFLGLYTSFSFHPVTLSLHLLPSCFPALDFLSSLLANSLALCYIPGLPDRIKSIHQLAYHGNFTSGELPSVLCSIFSEIPGWNPTGCLISVLFLYWFGVYVHSGTLHLSTFSTTTSQPTLNTYINYLQL